MIRIDRILKDFRETGALNSLIALWGFVDDTTFLTKAGAVGVLYRQQGVDFECLDHPQRQAIAHRFEQALRQLDESFRVYQYVLKRRAAPVTAAAHPHPVVDAALSRRTAYFAGKREELFELELYLVVLYEGGVDRPSWPSARRHRRCRRRPRLPRPNGRCQTRAPPHLSGRPSRKKSGRSDPAIRASGSSKAP